MKKEILSALVALMTIAPAVADNATPLTPETGKTYYIYNVASQQYLGTADGQLTLGDEKTAVTIGESDDASLGFVLLTTASGTIGADHWFAATADGTAHYQDWTLQPADGTTGAYLLANRQRETNACQYLYHSTAHSALSFVAQQPDADFTAGQWLFLSTDASGIASTTASAGAKTYDVYTLDGRCVRLKATTLQGLGHGVFIVNGRKVIR